ncbi:MAG: serine/threonine protein kinase [Planctomycetota bacterium]|nr:MAG: serine/threonine protein kinase [Planctomycetota bacterium]
MPDEWDVRFGQAALELGLITQAQLQGCFRVPEESVEAALVSRGILTRAQCEEVRKRLEPAKRPSSSVAMTTFATPALKDNPAGGPPEAAEGRYCLGPEIARGGLGQVLEAFDSALARTVAVKLVRADLPAAFADVFEKEAKLTARLEHPNIVPIHDFGRLPGNLRMFLCMKKIQGRDLGKLLQDLALGDEETRKSYSRTRLLGIFQEVCLGVAYAHDRGVIHRDLKPGNVMIGDFGETLIVDWGLAQVMSDQAGAPNSSEIEGTMAYMSPEQAAGEVGRLDSRSDVFSLGAILYEILTFQPPFEGDETGDRNTRIKSGLFSKPSRQVARVPGDPEESSRVLAPLVAEESIPPELDALCRKALAFRAEDRFQSAMELHDEIQVFLDGVKAREQKRIEAAKRVSQGRSQVARFTSLKEEIEKQAAAVRDWSSKIQAWQPAAEKRPLWEAEARLRALKGERIDAFSRGWADFAQALVVDPECVEASDGICDLFLGRFLEAEAKRNTEDMQLHRNTLAQFDREGRYKALLEAPGTFSVRTMAYACDCLRPVKHAEWRVQIDEASLVPWRDGRRRADLALSDGDRPVPNLTTFPEDARFGHAASCPRHDVAGVEVSIAKIEECDKRLVAGPERTVGKTPLAPLRLETGSWICTLRAGGFEPVTLPFRIDRGATWSQDVTLYRTAEIPAGFCYVPGGPFIFGGEWANGAPRESLQTQDLFVARFPATCADYLAFLNALATSGRIEEARGHQPREGEKKYWIESDGRFRLPTSQEDGKFAWDPRWPVFSINWKDALAWCQWKSGETGLRFELMHEEEYEKICRGVDGRVFSFGNEYDGAYSHTTASRQGGGVVLPVGSFPTDESVYGIRDLSGGMETWCANAPQAPFREWRCIRGGCWALTGANARAGDRRADFPTTLRWLYGVRPVVRPAR